MAARATLVNKFTALGALIFAKKKKKKKKKKKTPPQQSPATEHRNLFTALFTETGFSQTAKHLNGEITARTRPQAQKQ
jgi:hypothetical protein